MKKEERLELFKKLEDLKAIRYKISKTDNLIISAVLLFLNLFFGIIAFISLFNNIFISIIFLFLQFITISYSIYLDEKFNKKGDEFLLKYVKRN